MIEGTGRTTDVPIQTATMLESKGYETPHLQYPLLDIGQTLGFADNQFQ